MKVNIILLANHLSDEDYKKLDLSKYDGVDKSEDKDDNEVTREPTKEEIEKLSDILSDLHTENYEEGDVFDGVPWFFVISEASK